MRNRQSDTFFAMLLASIVAVLPFSIDAYLPAIPTISNALRSDIHQVEVTLGLFLIGSAIAQLIGGPFSDRNGRRNTALIGLAIYVIGSFGLSFSESIVQFKVFRLCQAFGAGFAAVIVAATVRDRFSGNEAARIFALVGIIMMGAPLLAPVIGTIMLKTFGWRSIFYFLAGYASFVFVVVFLFFQPSPTRQASRQSDDNRLPIWRQVIKNYAMVLKKHRALGYLCFQAASFGSMFAFLTESAFVYLELYGVSEPQFAIYFACNIITMALFNRITAFKLKTTTPQRILLFGLVLQVIANTSLLTFAQFGTPSLFVLVPLIMISVGSQGFVSANTTACYMDYFKENSGTANAVAGTFSFLVASVVGIMTTRLHDGVSIVPMTTMMLTATTIGAMLLFALSKDMRELGKQLMGRG